MITIKEVMYDCSAGWYVISHEANWYIGRINLGKVQQCEKIGPFRKRGTNYYDIAKELADSRNTRNGYVTEYAIPPHK